MLDKAFSIDTMVPPSWEFQVGFSHLLLRQYDEAVSRFLIVIERSPKFKPAYVYLACAYVELDRLDDARGAIKTALETTTKFNLKNVARFFSVLRLDEVRNRFLDSLRKAGLPEQ